VLQKILRDILLQNYGGSLIGYRKEIDDMAVSVLAGLHTIGSFALFFKFFTQEKVYFLKEVLHEFRLTVFFHGSVSPRS
jgi:hypothetical protein